MTEALSVELAVCEHERRQALSKAFKADARANELRRRADSAASEARDWGLAAECWSREIIRLRGPARASVDVKARA